MSASVRLFECPFGSKPRHGSRPGSRRCHATPAAEVTGIRQGEQMQKLDREVERHHYNYNERRPSCKQEMAAIQADPAVNAGGKSATDVALTGKT